ncbi:MAG: hypothetical protein MZU97_23230 [Bacillus subtilis]|nr:hypothetical protein [Bacillus subtilis]
MQSAIDDKIRFNALFDLYGELLTDKQKIYFARYYQDDYSLAEIADLVGVSRNAVFDQIQKTVEHLNHYEATLRLLEKQAERVKRYGELRKSASPEQQITLDELERLE